MRKIKFRAWRHDGEYSHMIESPIGVYTAIKHCLGVATPAGFSDIDNQPKKDGYTLMQWTGLKDRNGKEIYEGDIIRIRYHKWPKDDWEVYQVKYYGDKDYPAFDTEPYIGCDCNGLLYVMTCCEIEVIGNIFENPELLEVGKLE